jgi:4-amino-4-deoxy-L-arabinose transferase-like glycosyltransferase
MATWVFPGVGNGDPADGYLHPSLLWLLSVLLLVLPSCSWSVAALGISHSWLFFLGLRVPRLGHHLQPHSCPSFSSCLSCESGHLHYQVVQEGLSPIILGHPPPALHYCPWSVVHGLSGPGSGPRGLRVSQSVPVTRGIASCSARALP